jgi:hypothetical protein
MGTPRCTALQFGHHEVVQQAVVCGARPSHSEGIVSQPTDQQRDIVGESHCGITGSAGLAQEPSGATYGFRTPSPIMPLVTVKLSPAPLGVLKDETQDHRLVSGTRGDCEVAGRLMRREAGRIELDRADEKVGNVDGSPWIRNQVQRQSLPLDALGLDFYHLSENVHKARREIFGEDDEGGKRWVGQLLHVFKHDGYEAAWKQLLEWRVALKRGRSGGPAGELCQRTAGDDPLSRVSSQGMADH